MPTAGSKRIAAWVLSTVLLIGTTTARSAGEGLPAALAKISQHTAKGNIHRPEADEEFKSITDAAPALPPEFGADILIRLAQSNKLTDRFTKIHLLEKAFYLAVEAEQPIKLTTSVFQPDTRSGYLALAFRLQDLDRLSLQSRVISAMLPLDPAGARELLANIQFPVLPPVDCKEPLTYDVTPFYDMLGTVARDGIAPENRLEGGEVVLLTPYVASLQSHAQLKPLIQLLLNASLSDPELGRLANVLAGGLSQLQGDERSFAIANQFPGHYPVTDAMASLIEALNKRGIPTFAVLSAFREYTVSNFRGRRCSELVGKAGDGGPLPPAVRYFNQRFRSMFQNGQVAPITSEELTSARIGPEFTDTSFWQSNEAQQLFIGARGLIFGNGETRLTTRQRVTSGWSTRLVDFLNELAAWKSENEPSPVDFFCQKSALYSMLIDVIPTGRERSKAISDFVEFLEQNTAAPTIRLEWMLQVERLLSGAAAADDHEEVIRAFMNSRDPTLSLYARLERWEPRCKTCIGAKVNQQRRPRSERVSH